MGRNATTFTNCPTTSAFKMIVEAQLDDVYVSPWHHKETGEEIVKRLLNGV